MRITIVSQWRLPDPRVERQINTFLGKRHEVFLTGAYEGETGLSVKRIAVPAARSTYMNKFYRSLWVLRVTVSTVSTW